MGALIGLTLGVAIIMSGAFIPSPIAYFIDYLESFSQFNDILGYVLWFFPVARIVYFIGLWFTVYVSTLVTFLTLKLAKII